MRITNKIMQNNNLANINTNKIYQDALSNQMSTQKKINRPSDDPVVAIRSLRLRSNVTEVTQYYDRNIPDAESWLSVTEDALKNLTGIVTNMIAQCTKGSNGDLTTSDREIILEQLKALGDEVYSTGDADYAGRYVFTGYRTDTSLSFDKANNTPYEITEQVTSANIDRVTVVETKATLPDGTEIDLRDINSTNYKDVEVKDTDITSVDVYRIRLSYNNCADTLPTISYKEKQADGSYVDKQLDVSVMHDYEDPYNAIAAEDGTKAIYVPETGEILLSEKAYDALMLTKDGANTSTVDESEIRITYEKNKWEKGDLRPEHYFRCVSDKGTENEIEYNAAYLEGVVERQTIEYDVGFNQTIRVNSTADECFKHGIGREVDDLVNTLEQVIEMENIIASLNTCLETATGEEQKILKSRLEAADKAFTMLKENAQTKFENGITAMQGYLDEANLCITNCGTRGSKLALIESRMQTQKTTFETLQSENEDVDITDVAIKLTSAELTYEAALMATGKIAQTSLLQYI